MSNKPDICANCGKTYAKHESTTQCWVGSESKWFPQSLANAITQSEMSDKIVPDLDLLVAKYQCNPTGQLTSFEAIRNHLEQSHRLCNDNYDWAKRLEAKNQRLREHLNNGEQMYIAMRNRCASVEAENQRLRKENEKLTNLLQDM